MWIPCPHSSVPPHTLKQASGRLCHIVILQSGLRFECLWNSAITSPSEARCCFGLPSLWRIISWNGFLWDDFRKGTSKGTNIFCGKENWCQYISLKGNSYNSLMLWWYTYLHPFGLYESFTPINRIWIFSGNISAHCALFLFLDIT